MARPLQYAFRIGCRVGFHYALLIIAATWIQSVAPAEAHHILGRPAYGLNEDSNTPPAMQFESQVEDLFVNIMVYPAFPRPGEPGRINLYVKNTVDGTPYDGVVTFSAQDDSWSARMGRQSHSDELGKQRLDDNVYRQGFQFPDDGNYLIVATFDHNGKPMHLEFAMRIGDPTPIGPIGIGVALILVLGLGVTVIQRRRAMTGKVRAARDRPA